MSEDKLIEVGVFCQELNDLANTTHPLRKIFRSKGLVTHILKRKHYSCLKYVDRIPEIITSPDFIGISPNETESTIELIKVFDNSVLIGIKFDSARDYFFVSTMYVIQESKLERRTYSGRIKPISIDKPSI